MAVGKLWRLAVVCAALALVGTAAAQSLPATKEFYFDADPAAAPMVAISAQEPDLVDQLMRMRDRGRRALEATVQLGSIAAAQGRMDLAQALFSEALDATQASSQNGRSVRWNIAWTLYRQGDAAAALPLWAQALEGTRTDPSWAPPTLALVLWKLGRQDEAVKWFAAAVRTEPQQWSNPANFEQLLPAWLPEERELLAEVHAAWLANPPAWR